MDVIEYISTLRKRWFTVITLAIVGALAGFGWAAATDKTYEATSKVFVTVNSGNSVDDLVQGSTFTQNLVQSYTQLATTPVVLEPVIESLGLDVSARTLAKSVDATTPLNTVLIEISVKDGSPAKAARIANAIAAELPQAVDALSQSKPTSNTPVTIKTVARASEPRSPIAPRTKLLTLAGLGLGLLAGVSVALVRRLADTRVVNEDDSAGADELPVLGAIPRWNGSSSERISLLHQPRGPRAEAYRRLRSNLEFVRREGGSASSIVVTSSTAGEGKTTTAVNLAIAMAELGDKVLLIDADLRAPSVASTTGLEKAVGLSTVLVGTTSLEDAVQKWGDTTLDVLTSGEAIPNPLLLIDSKAMLDLVESASSTYDFVVIDSPPLLSVVDAVVLSHQSDGPLVVAAVGRTRRRDLAASLEAISVAGIAPIGMVLTRASREGQDDKYYGAAPGGSAIVRRLRRALRRLRGH